MFSTRPSSAAAKTAKVQIWLFTLLAVLLILIIKPSGAFAQSDLSADFDSKGLSSVRIDSAERLVDGVVRLVDLKLAGGDAVGDDFSVRSSSYDAAGRVMRQDYGWGSVATRYQSSRGRLTMTVDISNHGDKSLTRLGLTLLKLRFSPRPRGDQWEHGDAIDVANPDDLPVIAADWDNCRFAYCCDDPADFTPIGLHVAGDDVRELSIRINRAIDPGSHRTVQLSVRAGQAADDGALVADVLGAFAHKYPSELEWTDRRPIGSAFLATSQKGYPKNPRGWLLDPDIDVTTTEGRSQFRTKMFAYAASVVQHCKKMNAQGVIVWDLEGQEMPHATSYLADPRMLPQVAPEMDGIADSFMGVFTKAGLRTGLTIRPTRVVKADPDKPQPWMQQDAPDPVTEMDAKMTYAQKRWGCTLFYLDSNVTYVFDKNGKILDNPTMPPQMFRTLAEHHKDCLLMPEHKTARYWAYTAPYSEFRLGFTGTSDLVRGAYPHAFSVMQVVDGPSLGDQASVKTLTAAISHGDVLLFRPWWDDPQSSDIQHLYHQVHMTHAESH